MRRITFLSLLVFLSEFIFQMNAQDPQEVGFTTVKPVGSKINVYFGRAGQEKLKVQWYDDAKTVESIEDGSNTLSIKSQSFKVIGGLTDIYVGKCGLSAIDLSNAPSTINTLQLKDNSLESFDLGKAKNIVSLYLSMNKLKKLSINGLNSISTLDVADNQLTSLDVSNCPRLKFITCNHNEIGYEAMQKLINSLNTVQVNGKSLKAIDKDNEKNVCTKSQVKLALSKGWVVKVKTGPRYSDWSTYEGSEDPTAGKEFAITYSAENGTVSCATLKGAPVETGSKISEGTSLVFTATPNEGYAFDKWIVNGQDNAEKNVVFNITPDKDLEVKAVFVPKTASGVKVIMEAGEGGTVEGMWNIFGDNPSSGKIENGKVVPSKSSLHFTAHPAEGYRVSKWNMNGPVLDGPDLEQWSQAGEDGSTYVLKVEFVKIAYYKIEFSGEHCTVTSTDSENRKVESGASVKEGTSLKFEAVPEKGYEVKRWILNKDTTQAYYWDPTHFDAVINKDGVLKVVCEPIPKNYLITVTKPENGQLKASYMTEGTSREFTEPTEVREGVQIVMTATPDKGYVVDKWTYNGTPVEVAKDTPNLYRFVVKEAATIAVSFKKDVRMCVVSYSAENGTVSCATSKGTELASGSKVDEGTNLVFTAKPNSGYVFGKWVVNEKDNAEKGTTLNITATEDLVVKAMFVKQQAGAKAVISFSATDGGKISSAFLKSGDKQIEVKSGDEVPVDSVVVFYTQNNDANIYFFKGWKVNGEVKNQYQQYLPLMYTVLDGKNEIIAEYDKIPAEGFKVTYAGNEGGTIQGVYSNWTKGIKDQKFNSGDVIPANSSLKFDAQPKSGYRVVSWIVNGQEFPGHNLTQWSYTSNPVNVKVVFDQIKNYKVEYSGEHCTVSAYYWGDDKVDVPTGSNVKEDTEVTFQASPEAGYRVKSWIVNDKEIPAMASNRNQYTEKITQNTVVKAVCEVLPQKYTITLKKVENGSLKAGYLDEKDNYQNFLDKAEIEAGSKVTVEAVPAKGYQVDGWTYNGKAVEKQEGSDPNFYQFEVKEAATIAAKFIPITYTVTYSAGENGSLICTKSDKAVVASNSKVEAGQKLTFTATPNEGFVISKWVVNGTEKGVKDETLVETVNADLDVKVEFAKKPEVKKFTVTYSAGEGGDVSCTKSDKTVVASGSLVEEGSVIVFMAKAKEGYEFGKWIVNGKESEVKEASLTQTVSADLVVKAEFNKVVKMYTVTYSSDNEAKGKLSAVDTKTNKPVASGSRVEENTELKFTVTLSGDPMWIVGKWVVDGKDIENSKRVNEQTISIKKDTDVKVVMMNITSSESVAGNAVKAYIANDNLVIEGVGQAVRVALYTADGRLVFVRNVEGTTNVSNLASGVYFLRLMDKSFKLIKQ